MGVLLREELEIWKISRGGNFRVIHDIGFSRKFPQRESKTLKILLRKYE